MRSHRDSAYSLRDLAEIRRNLVQFGLISSRSDQISADSAQSQSNLVVSGENLTWFRNFQLRPRTDRYPTKSDHPNRFRSPVGGGSRNERPELIGSVRGWAQTRPRMLVRSAGSGRVEFLDSLVGFSFYLRCRYLGQIRRDLADIWPDPLRSGQITTRSRRISSDLD